MCWPRWGSRRRWRAAPSASASAGARPNPRSTALSALGLRCRAHYLKESKASLPEAALQRVTSHRQRQSTIDRPEIQPAVLETAAEGRMPAVQETVDQVRRIDVDQYKYGFITDIESDKAPKGLSEDTVRFISAKKNEPAWMLAWRLEAYRRWLTMSEPTWARVKFGPIDYQDLYYYSAPKKKDGPKSLDEIDPEILKTYDKLGIPLREREALLGIQREDGTRSRVAVDAVFDSVSVATTFQEELAKAGVLFMPISEALQKHPDLVKKYPDTVVPISDNFFATLNSAVFSDGSFVYVPPGVRCPMELSTYFRINERNTGQFERTLIIADKGSYVSYLEGCTAPSRDENQLHAAVVELIALDDAEIEYSTIQNWYLRDQIARGGVYNFVTKRGDCRGARSKISWTQLE